MDDTQGPGFEERMERLQEIVRDLEKADLPLERNVALYKEGRALVKACTEILEQAKHEISLCGEDGQRPFPMLSDDDERGVETAPGAL